MNGIGTANKPVFNDIHPDDIMLVDINAVIDTNQH